MAVILDGCKQYAMIIESQSSIGQSRETLQSVVLGKCRKFAPEL